MSHLQEINYREVKNRILKVYQKLDTLKVDALFVSSSPNVSYLSGYESHDSWLILSKKRNYYLTDARYTEDASRHIHPDMASVKDTSEAIFPAILQVCNELGIKKLAIEESLTISYEHFLHKTLMKKVSLVPTKGIIEPLRQYKSLEELKKIRKAIAITVKALNVISPKFVEGKTELQVAGDLERFIRYQGAEGMAFELIVASGAHASQPHHQTSHSKIRKNTPLLIDIGVSFQGYKSDLTKTFLLGKISVLALKLYRIVKEAHDLAVQAVKPGVAASEIDTIARGHINQAGYGAYFNHSSGHGVGIEVHEAPRISRKDTTRLEKGMVFTIEPGIYLPGKIGIRIEDMVLVTERGCEVLSGSINK